MQLTPTLQKRLPSFIIILWGLFLAGWLARGWFTYPADRLYLNHEMFSYVGRLIEFRDQLGAGYLSPQWCTNFRGGLGSPHNLYYQPGLFYVASLVPWSVSPVRALGVAVAAFALLGYVAMYRLIAERFGRAAGCLAASALLLGAYTGTNLYIRGDLSEYAAMMTLPAALCGLAGWLEHGRLRAAVGLTVAAASLIVLHPAVGLLGFGLLGLAVLAFALEPALPSVSKRQDGRVNPVPKTLHWSRVVTALLLLGLAIGLAAFYWVPVFFGLSLVKSEEAFAGGYCYTQNFLPSLARLVAPYRHPWPEALTLDVWLPLVALVSLLSLPSAWSTLTTAQRRLAVFCLTGALCFALLTVPLSMPLWQVCGPLQRIQFPWRALTIVTVLLAASSGTTVLWRANKRRTGILAVLLLALWALSCRYTAFVLHPHRVPQNTIELLRANFAPDICGEWLPRGASKKVPQAYRDAPRPGPHCQVEGFRRTQGRLTCRIRATTATTVTLPHYYFPTGWQATLNGTPVALKAGPYGLMQVDIPQPAQGELVVTFSCTPLRAIGLFLSALSATIGLGLLAFAKHRQSRKGDLEALVRPEKSPPP